MLRPWLAGWLFALGASLSAQDDALREKVNRALEEARPTLLKQLQEASANPTSPGLLALLVLAAIHDGVPPDDPVLQAAIPRLAAAKPRETYDLALRLCVLEVCPTFPDRVAIARQDCKQLLRHRDGDGGFSYSDHPVQWDLSNTQYAALGLRAAKALGVPVERPVWAKLAKAVGDLQDNYGGFGYTKAGEHRPDAYASMTAAGIAVLAICRQALGEEEQRNTTLAKQIGRGWQWFARYPGVVGSIDERWSYYFHYGLERAAILCDQERIDDKDWYALGAEMLVREQLSDGGWQGREEFGAGALAMPGLGGPPGGPPPGGPGALGGPRGARSGPVATAFAVLFLRRKFQKVAVPITPRHVSLLGLGPAAKAEDVAACAADLVQRGKAALDEVLAALRSECGPQRQAAAAALRGIAGDTFGYDPALDADANRAAIRRAELWHLKNR